MFYFTNTNSENYTERPHSGLCYEVRQVFFFSFCLLMLGEAGSKKRVQGVCCSCNGDRHGEAVKKDINSPSLDVNRQAVVRLE
uniref:Uncharacterized protein n=1 Tax=Anguilla anguilla TaxID=7936 RepID=A0A0E9X9F2_ANGAN